MAEQKQDDYNAANIIELERRVQARHRIGMWLGSNHHAGVTTGFRELADNSIDEATAGHGNEINLTFHADGSGEVEDFGRGLPVDKNKAGVNGIMLTLGTIGSGGKYNSDSYGGVSSGQNGVGASVTVAASSMAHVISYRNGKKNELFFKEGLPGFFAKNDDPKSKFTPSEDIRVSADDRPAALKKAHPTGTKVRFWPDYTVFLPDSRFMVDDIKSRMRAVAFLVPGLTIKVHDYRDPANPVEDVYSFSSGLGDMVPTLTHHPLVTKTVHLESEGSFIQTTNVMDNDGKMHQGDVERKVKIDVAFAYTNVEETVLKSYVNIINTHDGGTHEKGLWLALSKVFTDYIKDNARSVGLKAKEEPPIIDDVRDGFTGVIAVAFGEPTFSGQAKGSLATPQITSVVSQAVRTELTKWIADKKNATELKKIATKIVEASRIRVAAKQQKDTARKKSALETSASMPAKLTPCISKNPEEISLLICEGKSALGGLKQARDARLAAIYPLRGKPSNTYDMTLGAILKNQEWSDLIQILGAGIGKDCDPSKLRYKTIIVVADADDDGMHIFSLVSAGFWRLMRPVIEQGHFYVALPPLFSITTAGRNPQRYYALDEPERDVLVAKLAKEGKKYDKITRHKGLGEYAPEILGDTVLNPATRRLKRVSAEDVEAFERMLELTMGKDADARKEWILENRALISEDEIDA